MIFMVLKSGKGRRRTGRRRKGTREECREGREEGIGVRGLENGSGVGRGGRGVGWGGQCGEARAAGTVFRAGGGALQHAIMAAEPAGSRSDAEG